MLQKVMQKQKISKAPDNRKNIKKIAHYTYTIVSACYNNAIYLEEYFKSIMEQSIDFKDNIQIICIDDGSTDNTAQIIKEWQAKYPNNIIYSYQENQGQAIARNKGLTFATHSFVTFINPDNFIHQDYFQIVDNCIHTLNPQNVCMLCTNLIFYNEATQQYEDTHPLNFKFQQNQVMNVSEIGNNIQLFVNTTFFNVKHLKQSNILFDDRIRPNFADGHFIAQYLLPYQNYKVAFLKDAHYFYRKRTTSTNLDLTWEDPRKFDDVLQYGYLSLLKLYQDKLGFIPEYIQKTILYDTLWRITNLINKPEKLAFLSNEQQETFYHLFNSIMKKISNKTILDFNMAGMSFYYQLGILNLFKNTQPNFQMVYIERYDAFKNEVLIKYFAKEIQKEEFCIQKSTQEQIYKPSEHANIDDTIKPRYTKTINNEFCGRTFILQRWHWLPLEKDSKNMLYIRVNNLPTRISLQEKEYQNAIPIEDIYHAFLEEKPEPTIYSNAWLFKDRNYRADDNAEHLYRYIMHTHKDINAYFILEETSHDWKRLKEEGFQLLAYGSKAHEDALRECTKFIASHANKYLTEYFNHNFYKKIPFIFLQHGVIKDNLSNWLNSAFRFDIFCTSTFPEYQSITHETSKYKFTKKEVKLTGLARHDALLKQAQEIKVKKQILLIPTWRSYLVSSVTIETKREKVQNFMENIYAKTWQNFLQSKKLAQLQKEYGYEIVFFPHQEIQQYLNEFHIPKTIKVLNHTQINIQNLFLESQIMITDFSSVAFEMAYLEKAVLYYQFDEKEFFTKHGFQKGYFDYRRDGFGPVCIDEKSLLNSLERILKNNGLPEAQYLEKMQKTFAFKDGKCCERIYNAIYDLDRCDANHGQEKQQTCIK